MSIAETPRKRWSWCKRVILLVCGSMLIWGVFQLWPVWLEPGPKTTVITGPIRSNGLIDYVAYLNSEFSDGVLPEDNAVVLLLECLGPEAIDVSIRREYVELLGADLKPNGGPYYQSLGDIYPDEPEKVQRLWDEWSEAVKGPWRDADHPELAEWLALNEQPMKLCAEACRRPKFFAPLVPPGGGPIMHVPLALSATNSRELARFLQARVTHHLGAGRVEYALEDSITIHRLSRLLSQNPFVIQQLVATALSAVAAQCDSVIIQSALLNADQASRQRELVASLHPFPDLADILDHGERLQSLNAMQWQFMGPGMVLGRLQPNAMLSRVNEAYDELVAAMRIEDRQTQAETMTALRAKIRQRATPGWGLAGRLALNPRRAIAIQTADTMVALLLPAAAGLPATQRRRDIRIEQVIAGYALAEYRARNGQFPKTLEQLVPDYLEHVPQDPYADVPFRYVVDHDQNSILLYSIGENGVDDHGRMKGGGPDDIAFGTVPDDE